MLYLSYSIGTVIAVNGVRRNFLTIVSVVVIQP